MKKKTLLISAISVVLAVLIALGGIWFLFFKGDSGNIVDVLRLTTVDEILLQEDFTSTPGGDLPKGWVKTFPYKFINAADKSTALATEGGNKNHVSVRREDDSALLSFYGRDGGNITTLPGSFAGDIVISFDLRFRAFRTPFGIALGLAEDPNDATKATIFQLYGKEKELSGGETGLIPTFALYDRISKGGDYVGADKNRREFVAKDYIPNQVEITDRKSGTGTIPVDNLLSIKVYRYNGIYYFYCDGLLITTAKDTGEGDRIGFFSDLSGREVEVTNLSVCSLGYAPDVEKKTYNIGSLYEADFSDKTLDVGEWSVINDFNKSTAECRYDRSDKGTFLSSKETALLRSPALDSRNMKLTASVVAKSETGRIGLFHSMNASVNKPNAAVFAGIDLEAEALVGGDLPDMRFAAEYTAEDISKVKIKPGQRYDLTLYIFDGRQYLFVNGEFAFNSEIPTSFKKQYCGFIVMGGEMELLSFRAEALVKRGAAEGLVSNDPALTIGEASVGLDITGKLQNSDPLYDFVKENETVESGFLISPKVSEAITIDTEGVTVLKATFASGRGGLDLTAELKELRGESLGKLMELRGYFALKNGDETEYFYGPAITVNPAAMASNLYLSLGDKEKAMLDTLFEGCDSYIGKYEKTLTFSLFSDFHYKYGMYSTSVSDMNAVFDRANKAGAEFILSGGDFCNDFAGSPELLNAFLKNKYNMPAYNVYGNHELEAGNNMQYVTPLLTNDKEVVWGTIDGKIGDGTIAYYYFDHGGFRVVCTDTNYSYNPLKGEWEHNHTGSYGPPEGNTKSNALGPVQLEWLEEVLTDAAHNGLPCIVIGHAAFTNQIGGASADAQAVRDIYTRVNNLRKGTVLLSINGHYHTNRIIQSDDILFFDMNTTRNGEWRGTGDEHYGPQHTFEQVEYDSMGAPVNTRKVSLGELTMGKNTWFFEEPLSAIVKISQYGTVTVEGMESRWIYGVNPTGTGPYTEPKVSSGTWELIKK